MAHARRVPFYNSYLPLSISSLEDFRALPIIDKRTLVNNQSDMRLPIPEIGMQYYQTSGTSGVHVTNVRNSLELRPHFQRASRFFLYAIENLENERFMNLLYYGGRWSGGIGAHSIFTEGLINFVPVGAVSDVEELAKHWQETFPTGAIVSPPWFVHLTRKLENKDLLNKIQPLSRMFYLGEKLTPSQIEYLKGKTITPDCQIHSVYATTEAGMIGLQIFPNGPVFIVPDAAYIEVVDESGNPVPQGEGGILVVTSFNRLTQPLIRYNTGDIGRLLSEEELNEFRLAGFYAPALELKGREGEDFKIADGFLNTQQLIKGIKSIYPQIPILNYQFVISSSNEGKTVIDCILEVPIEERQTDVLNPEAVAMICFDLPPDFIAENVIFRIQRVPSGAIERHGPAQKIRHLIDMR